MGSVQQAPLCEIILRRETGSSDAKGLAPREQRAAVDERAG